MPARAESDPEGLLQSAYNMKYNAKKMKKLEKEYNAIKTKEQEEMSELKVSCIFIFNNLDRVSNLSFSMGLISNY